MEQQLKQRLVGAAVLVVLAVIFLPMLLDSSGRSTGVSMSTNIPPKPEGGFSSRVIPIEGSIEPEDAASGRLDEPRPPAPAPVRVGVPAAGSAPAEPPSAPAAPADAAGIEPASAWAVQVGSFSGKDNAARLRQELVDKGYKAFVETTYDDEGKPVFRVRVGPELLRSGAKKLAAGIERDAGVKGIVISYP